MTLFRTQGRGSYLGLTAFLGVAFLACEPDLDSLVAGQLDPAEAGSSGGTVGVGGGSTSTSAAAGGSSGVGGGTTDTGGAGGTGGTGTSSAAGAAGEPGTSTTGGAGAPPVDHCEDKQRNSGESDVDCGGPGDCSRCELGARCIADTDCFSEYCAANRCEEPSCNDGVQNQNETAIDCGGGCAPAKRCALGQACKADRDCDSGACASQICVEHCESGKRDADETATDCGGAVCDPCGTGKNCDVAEDCLSGVCDDNECAAATCNDGVANQEESDVDCGGNCAPLKSCALNAVCNSAADCQSYVCAAGRCVPDVAVPVVDMLDDLEDGNTAIIAQEGRNGSWYAFGDGTGIDLMEAAVIPGQRGPDSEFALKYSGAGFTTWGSGTGFDLTANPKAPWDASAFDRVTFWARAASPIAIVVALPDRNTDPDGGLCTRCYHHWFTSVSLTTAWKRYIVEFSQLQLEAGTEPEPSEFALDGVVSIQFRPPNGIEYEFWLDDIAFLRPK